MLDAASQAPVGKVDRHAVGVIKPDEFLVLNARDRIEINRAEVYLWISGLSVRDTRSAWVIC